MLCDQITVQAYVAFCERFPQYGERTIYNAACSQMVIWGNEWGVGSKEEVAIRNFFSAWELSNT